MRATGLRAFLLAALCCLTWAVATPARAADDWRSEFDAVCGRTSEAMTMSESELVELTERCARLEQAIAGLPETERKVFSMRLQMCKDLFQFMLDSKRHGQPAN
jgi:hypothetical protein